MVLSFNKLDPNVKGKSTMAFLKSLNDKNFCSHIYQEWDLVLETKPDPKSEPKPKPEPNPKLNLSALPWSWRWGRNGPFG